MEERVTTCLQGLSTTCVYPSHTAREPCIPGAHMDSSADSREVDVLVGGDPPEALISSLYPHESFFLTRDPAACFGTTPEVLHTPLVALWGSSASFQIHPYCGNFL